MIRTFADSCVYLAAFRNDALFGQAAQALLLRAPGLLICSDYLRLEIVPKAFFHRNLMELRFYESTLDRCLLVPNSPHLQTTALQLACEYGLAAGDATLIAAAVLGSADVFITTEKPSKPMFRVKELKVRHILDVFV